MIQAFELLRQAKILMEEQETETESEAEVKVYNAKILRLNAKVSFA